MTPNRLAILIIILIAILVGYVLDFSNELRNFALATAVLVCEVCASHPGGDLNPLLPSRSGQLNGCSGAHSLCF
jgi:hypothetical protein